MSKASNIDLSQFYLLDAISTENFQINPTFIKMTGSITTAFFLTQIMFLFRSYKYKPFYQTDKKMKERYSFTEWELRASRKKLQDMGLIKITRGKANVLYYEIDVSALIGQYEVGAVDKKKSAEETSGGVPRKPRDSAEETSGHNNNKQRRYIKNNKQDRPVDKKAKIKDVCDAVFNKKESFEMGNSTHLYLELKSVLNLGDSTIEIILKDWEQFEIINALQSCKQKYGLNGANSARYLMGALKKIKIARAKTG
jgi:hypothetical protein